MAKAPLTFGNLRNSNPSPRKFNTVWYCISFATFGAKVSIQEEVADAVKERGRTDPYASFRALTDRLVATLKSRDKSDARPGSDSTRRVAV
jgi:hypothetical protein